MGIPEGSATACAFSLNEFTMPHLAPVRSTMIRSSRDMMSTPSPPSRPGTAIGAANCIRWATSTPQEGHRRVCAQLLQNRCPQGDSCNVASSYEQYPQGALWSRDSRPIICPTDFTFASGDEITALSAAGMCSSYSKYQGSLSWRYVWGEIGDGGLGNPVTWVKYAAFITVR
jgi:hypothetical protein